MLVESTKWENQRTGNKKLSVVKERKAKKERKLGLQIQFSLMDLSLHF